MQYQLHCSIIVETSFGMQLYLPFLAGRRQSLGFGYNFRYWRTAAISACQSRGIRGSFNAKLAGVLKPSSLH